MRWVYYISLNVPQKLVLIDGKKMVELMIEHDIRVSTETVYKIKKNDTDFFEEI